MLNILFFLILGFIPSLSAEVGFYEPSTNDFPEKVVQTADKIFRLFVYLDTPLVVSEVNYKKIIDRDEIDPFSKKLISSYNDKLNNGKHVIPFLDSCSAIILTTIKDTAMLLTAAHCFDDAVKIMESISKNIDNIDADRLPATHFRFREVKKQIIVTNFKNEIVYDSTDRQATVTFRTYSNFVFLPYLFKSLVTFSAIKAFDLENKRKTFEPLEFLNQQAFVALKDFAVLTLANTGTAFQGKSLNWSQLEGDQEIYSAGYPAKLSQSVKRPRGIDPSGEKLSYGKGKNVLIDTYFQKFNEKVKKQSGKDFKLNVEDEKRLRGLYSETMILTDSDCSGAMSGGPLLNSSGNIIGIITGGFPDSQSLNPTFGARCIGVPADKVIEAINVSDKFKNTQ